MKIRPSKRVGFVEEYYFSQKLKEIAAMNAAGAKVINLGIGSPDLPPSPKVLQALSTLVLEKDKHAYQSYKGHPDLRKAFADWYKGQYKVALNATTEILPLMGSKEGIMHLSMAYLEAGDEVLVPNPGYPAYSATAKLAGAKIRKYDLTEENKWLPDFETLEQLDLTKVKIMWVNYPHMPTGTQATTALFEDLIAFGKKHQILICNDNPYSFILNEKPQSILTIEGAKETAVEFNSLSKSHNMAGWRIGVLAANEEIIQNTLRFKSNMDSGMFLPLQLAAIEALQLPNKWFKDLNKIYSKRRLKAFEILDTLKCSYDPQKSGLFIWAKIPNEYENAFGMSDAILEEAKVFITPGGIFGSQGEKYLRISLCNPIEVMENAMERIVKIQKVTVS